MKPLTAAERIAEHTGNDDYLAPVMDRSGAPAPQLPAPDRSIRAATHDRPAPPYDGRLEAAPPMRPEPGRRSLLTPAQLAESDRIQQLVRAFWARETQ